MIDELPKKSLHYKDFNTNDELVNDMMENLVANHAKSFINVYQPKLLEELIPWTKHFLEKTGVKPDVVISNPTKQVYQIHQYTDDKDIYFFTNVHRFETTTFSAKFPIVGKYPYIWNPETGDRKPFYYASNSNELDISLNPLESLLLVFEDEKPSEEAIMSHQPIKASEIINTKWKVLGNRIDGKTFSWEMNELLDFSKSTDTTKNSFGGEMIYKTTINNTGDFTHIDLGDVNEGVTELYINGKKAGKRWYGKAIYPIADFLNKGNNDIEIHYTTVLANYCKSINNPLTNRWTRIYKDKVPTGLEGTVKLLSY